MQKNCVLTILEKISIIIFVNTEYVHYKKHICKEKNMIAKIWKKVLFAILIIACLFNVVNKLVHKASLDQELQSSAEYIQEKQIENGL